PRGMRQLDSETRVRRAQQQHIRAASYELLDHPEARGLIFNIEQAPARRAARRPRLVSRLASKLGTLDGRLLRFAHAGVTGHIAGASREPAQLAGLVVDRRQDDV